MSENVGNSQASNENQGLVERQLGAKMLTMGGFRQRRETVDEYGEHHNIVDSSLERLKNRGEKLIGKNDERRNDAYLLRLARIIEKGGNEYEKKLWQDSIKEDLLVQYENIPESYWESKRQELRDNQQGGVDLNESLKRQYCEKERKLQRESLEKWANYLGDENCPYPLWFKVYAWDGMTKMGRYSKKKACYETRNETTVAPYPYPDAEVLAKTFEVVNQYFGNNQKEFYTDEGERNIPLEKVVQSGSFVKIFNGIQRDIAPILQPPENPEDVDGQWLEYSLGDEDDIARAARGTGWCVATPAVGRYYLTYGTYGNDYGGDDWGDGESQEELQSKFILFHLTDPETGKLSKTACASIRIGPDGNVAEISGIEEGQALTDSVVPTVEEKVKSLPGGEAFLRKFADKNTLIELDHKTQRGEDVTTEEFRFIWELDRPIETLDTYNTDDPRIDELREKYGSEYAAEHGYNIPDTTIEQIESNLEKYLVNDANLDSNLLTYVLKKQLENSPEDLKKHLLSPSVAEKLMSLGGAEQIARMFERIRNLETLETENYIFMLPKDQWDKGKIELTNCPEYSAIAPKDLTAVLKKPVEYDYRYETDGRIFGQCTVYTESWIGKEIRHFPWSKELFEAESKLLKPNGYKIPESWRPVVDSVEKEIGSSDDEKVSLALREKLKLALSGYVWEGDLRKTGDGRLWYASECSAYSAYCLYFYDGGVYLERHCQRSGGQPVRCVAESGSSPNS